MSASLYKRNIAAQGITEDELGEGVIMNQPRMPVILPTIGVNRTLTPQECGSLISLPDADGVNNTLSIPEPATVPGRGYRFVNRVDQTGGASWDIETISVADVIQGSVYVSTGGVGATTGGSAVSRIRFVNVAAVAGDACDIISDGTFWYVNGNMAAVGGITLTT